MPELSRFLGIAIGMFPRDHAPPHFHAVYGEYQITVDIQNGIVHGDFPKRYAFTIDDLANAIVQLS